MGQSSVIEILANILPVFFVMYVYPRFVFSFFLKGKSALYKIFFCFSTMLVGLTVLVVGVFFVFNSMQVFYFIIIFYGIFLASAIWKIIVGIKSYKKQIFLKIRDWFVDLGLRIKDAFCWSWLLLAVAIFLCMYTSVTYIWVNKYFNFTDMYIHCEWVFDMFSGKIFTDGIYPFGMHCCLYAFTVVANMNPANIYLYLTFTQNLIIFLSFYALCKVIFKSRYIATLPLLLFGTLYFAQVYGPQAFKLTRVAINRFLVCLPQEFCLFALFAGMAALIMIFRANYGKKVEGAKFAGWQYLILYALCVASTITSHIYITFFLLVGTFGIFVCFAWKQNWRTNLSFVVSGFVGVLAGILPYAIYFIKFPKFEESIKWGLKVILGWRELDFVSVAASENSASSVYSGSDSSSSSSASGAGSSLSGDVPELESSDNSGGNFIAWLGDIYNNSIVPFFGYQLAPLFVVLFVLAIALTVFLLVYGLRKAKDGEFIITSTFLQKDVDFDKFDFEKLRSKIKISALAYLAIFITLVLLYVFYASPVLGIPRLMESYRLVVEIYFFFTLCLFIPIDILYRLLIVCPSSCLLGNNYITI